MASKIKETHTKVVTGILNLDNFTIEVEDVGTLTIKELFMKFNGEEVSITVKKVENEE